MSQRLSKCDTSISGETALITPPRADFSRVRRAHFLWLPSHRMVVARFTNFRAHMPCAVGSRRVAIAPWLMGHRRWRPVARRHGAEGRKVPRLERAFGLRGVVSTTTALLPS